MKAGLQIAVNKLKQEQYVGPRDEVHMVLLSPFLVAVTESASGPFLHLSNDRAMRFTP